MNQSLTKMNSCAVWWVLCELCDTAQGTDPGPIVQESRFHPPLRAVHGAGQDDVQSAEHLWQRGSPCGQSHQSLCCSLSLLPLPIITVWLTGCKTSNYLLITVAMCLFVLCVTHYSCLVFVCSVCFSLQLPCVCLFCVLLITVALCLFVLCVVDRTLKSKTLLTCTEYISGGICLKVHLSQL